MRVARPLLYLLVGSIVASLSASVVGVSKPAEPLTQSRVDKLPARERAQWTAYLQRSEAQMRADKAALAAECRGGAGLVPKEGFSGRSIPLHRDEAFYRSAAARHVGDVIVSFQTPAGGWSKNLDMSGTARVPCERFAPNNLSRYLGKDDFDQPRDPEWNYVGTLDNDATNTELHYLALLSAAWPGHDGNVYRASFLRGIDYLLRAQYPNGGWPQVWPLEGGYHDAITFNDDAVTESAQTLTLAARGERVEAEPEDAAISSVNEPRVAANGASVNASASEDYTFVPANLRVRARAAADKALRCILATQVRVPAPNSRGTVLTVWAQQHDPLTLAPVAGRNFEPAALSSGESASVMEYLMSLPAPSPAVERAVKAAAAWFEAHRIEGYAWVGGRSTPGGRKLTAQPGATPLWARYYSLSTGKPIFGDRDKTIHDDVMELSLERRNGYAWYGSGPERALDEFAQWQKKIGSPASDKEPSGAR